MKPFIIYRERYSSIGLFENEVYEGIPDVLKSLREEDHMPYVATSKAEIFAKQIIGHFNLEQYFHTVYGSKLDWDSRR